jgi:hypothetical protein
MKVAICDYIRLVEKGYALRSQSGGDKDGSIRHSPCDQLRRVLIFVEEDA